MMFRQDADGKRAFLSVDSRSVVSNPLYSAFKAKSFTAGDITFHFCILDLLADGAQYSVSQIVDLFAEKYLSRFSDAHELDQSSVRKKLREYVALGILQSQKRGRELIYSRCSTDIDLDGWRDAIAFYSQADPLGVIGSFLLDKYSDRRDFFRFKHHYILHALDSQVLYDILTGMGEGRGLTLSLHSRRRDADRVISVFPLKIYVSTQTGRHYLLGYDYRIRRIMFIRLDSIISAVPGEHEPEPEKYRGMYERFVSSLWGVSTGSSHRLEHIELTVTVGRNEEYIAHRLMREKRCGTVVQLDGETWLFFADVYDASELLPWMRTFIGRIKSLYCSNEEVCRRFYDDLDAMWSMYGGDADAVQ